MAPIFTGNKFKFSDYTKSDLNFNKISLLLKMDGANGSTSFIDSSKNNVPVLVRGALTAISTAQSKFGGSSGYFDGSGNYLTYSGTYSVNGTEIFNLKNTPATIELFFRPTRTTPQFETMLYKGRYGSHEDWSLSHNGSSILFGTMNTAGSAVHYISANCTITYNTWHHIAATNIPGVGIKLWFNGSQVAFSSGVNFSNNTASTGVTIAGGPYNNLVNLFRGYLDEVKITKEVLYTSDFIPPIVSSPVY
jgi:hypothetical protein